MTIRGSIFFILVSLAQLNFAQVSSPISSSKLGEIIVLEKKLQRLGIQMLMDSVQANRTKNARDFVKTLVEALKVENSFQYKFDSLPYLARVYAEDQRFRIFTFQVMLDNYTFVHYGCIQFNQKNLKLIPLKDFSDTFPITPQYTVTNKNWLGAVYYKLFSKKVNNKQVYFLFGYDQNDILSDKKYIEPMWLEGDTIAKFGMPIFEKTTTKVKPVNSKLMTKETKLIKDEKITKTYYRYILEYKKRGTVSLRYDKEKDLIIHDLITPLDNKSHEVGFMKVPDGTYEGLQWENNKWVWKDYVKVAGTENNDAMKK